MPSSSSSSPDDKPLNIATARPLPVPVEERRNAVALGAALGTTATCTMQTDGIQSTNAYAEQNKVLRELRESRLARLKPKIQQIFIPDPGMTETGTHVNVAERIGEEIGSQLWKTGACFLCDILERLVITAERRRASGA